MRKVKIVTDSTSDLSPELIAKHQIGVLSLYVNFGDETFRDGIDLDARGLYQKVDEYGKLPKTAAPSIGDFIQFFKNYIDEDYDIIYVGLSSHLSATYQNAVIAAGELPEGRVVVYDSLNLSTGIGLQVMKAVDYAAEGLGVEEIASRLKGLTDKIETEFIIDTLDYLHKGGRCSGLQNFIGTMLKIRPVVKVIGGKMILADKVRGKRQRALDALLNNALKNKDKMDLSRIFVTHSLGDEDALFLKEKLEAETDAKEVIITNAGCVISSHCGPNTVGILYIMS